MDKHEASRVMLGRDAAQVPIGYTDRPISRPNCSYPYRAVAPNENGLIEEA